MSSVSEIAEALPKLTNDELREVERTLLQTYRERKIGIIFDDAYGTLTEQDLAAIHDAAMRVIEGEPPKP
jgi:hypothetical protein